MASRPDKPGKKRAGKDLVKRSTEANAPKESTPEGEESHHRIEEVAPPAAAAEQAKVELILELIWTGNIASLLTAFRASPWSVSDMIAALARTDRPAWAGEPRLAPALVSLLEERVHKPEPFFETQLSKALGGGFFVYIMQVPRGGLDFFFVQGQLTAAPAPQGAVGPIGPLHYYEVPTSPEFKVERELVPDDWVTQRLAETAKELEIRKAAIAQIIAPRHEEPAKETLPPSSSLGSVDLQPGVISSPVGTELAFSHALTIYLEFDDTIPVIRKDASQHVTSGPAAALPPPLDLSSFQITTDHRRGDFSQAPPTQATPSEVRADGVDLANASLTTTDPVVLHTRVLLVPETGSNKGPMEADVVRKTIQDISGASASASSAEPVIERPIHPVAGPFLDFNEMIRWASDIKRWRTGVPFDQAIAEIRDFIEFGRGKHFPRPEENVALANAAKELVGMVGCEFRYNGERARLSCVPATGRFEVWPRTRGKSLITSIDFPNLEITPQEAKAVPS